MKLKNVQGAGHLFTFLIKLNLVSSSYYQAERICILWLNSKVKFNKQSSIGIFYLFY
jgi:hypothetical protein